MHIRRGAVVSVVLSALAAHAASACQAGGRNPDWDWPTYNRDLAGTRYSRLTQINTTNVSTLTEVWSYRAVRADRRRPDRVQS
jgi:glucose dehydrogenase